VLYIVAGVVFCGLIAMLVAWQRQKERKLTERKDSWDISTMFTDEANLPDAEEMIDVEPERGGAGAALADGDGALVPLDEDQPQALQKITQVRTGVEMNFKFAATASTRKARRDAAAAMPRLDAVDAVDASAPSTRRRRRRGPVRVYASLEGARFLMMSFHAGRRTVISLLEKKFRSSPGPAHVASGPPPPYPAVTAVPPPRPPRPPPM